MKQPLALFVTILVAAQFASVVSLAQAPKPPELALAEMKKLAFLTGNWRGEGWVEFAPGQRRTFTSREIVEFKLDGVLLLIEGMHHMKLPGVEQDLKIHHALATVTFDPEAKSFRMTAHKSDNKSVPASPKFARAASSG